MLEYPHWLVKVVPKYRASPILFNVPTLESALQQVKLAKSLKSIARIFLVINDYEFKYIIEEDKLMSKEGSYKVTWKESKRSLLFRDVNEAMEACRELQQKGRDEMKIDFNPDIIQTEDIKLGEMTMGVDWGKDDDDGKANFQLVVMDKLNLPRTDKKNDKPDRDTVISGDEITDLSILLNTESDFDSLLEKL